MKCSILCMVRAFVSKIILQLNISLYCNSATSEILSKSCLLKKGTLPFLDLQYIHCHLNSPKHHVHSNLLHQFIQHQYYDWEHLNKSHPVKWIEYVCVAQMLWKAFSLKLFPLLENKDWSHLKQRAQRVNCCQHVFAILVLRWTTGISPYFFYTQGLWFLWKEVECPSLLAHYEIAYIP